MNNDIAGLFKPLNPSREDIAAAGEYAAKDRLKTTSITAKNESAIELSRMLDVHSRMMKSHGLKISKIGTGINDGIASITYVRKLTESQLSDIRSSAEKDFIQKMELEEAERKEKLNAFLSDFSESMQAQLIAEYSEQV